MLKKLDLRDFQNQEPLTRLIPYGLLEKEYFKQSQKLDQEYSPATIKTMRENVFMRAIRDNTKLEYKRSFWIGSYNADFLFPALRLAIEIDGKVHDQELKSKIDHSKINYFMKLGISISSIENFDFNQTTVMNILRSLGSLPRLDSRGRLRLLRNIYLATLAEHQSNEQLSEAFGENKVDVFQYVRRCL